MFPGRKAREEDMTLKRSGGRGKKQKDCGTNARDGILPRMWVCAVLLLDEQHATSLQVAALKACVFAKPSNTRMNMQHSKLES